MLNMADQAAPKKSTAMGKSKLSTVYTISLTRVRVAFARKRSITTLLLYHSARRLLLSLRRLLANYDYKIGIARYARRQARSHLDAQQLLELPKCAGLFALG